VLFSTTSPRVIKSSPSPPPPGEEEEEGVVVVMASLQLLLPFCCKGAPLPGPPPPPPPPTAVAEATTLTGAFCIATALVPFLSFPSLFSKKKNQKLQMNFTLNFLKKDFKLIFSKRLVQILLPIATKEEDEEELLSLHSFLPSFHPPPSPKESVSGVRIYRELFRLSGENGVSAKP
jgi:hypothetical protein